MAQTIQGLNLESHITTIKIQLNGKYIGLVTQILDKIASFHPIFLTEYTVSPEEIVIRSKLPHIWRESESTFLGLAKGDITLEEAEKYIIDTVIAKRIKSMSTIPVLFTAHSKNIETIPVLDDILLKGIDEGYKSTFNRYYVIGSGKGCQTTGSISSTKDAYLAQNIQRDKWSTNTIIQRLNLPMPKWQAISNITELEECWSEYDKPVVIKPTGLVGGHGVVVGINTLEEAKKAYKFAQDATKDKDRSAWQKKIMIQEQVKGEDYRLLVINGKLEITTKRIPAFVIGDGKKNIQELIEETNKDPRRDVKNPSHILKPIVIDQPLKSCIKEQGYTLESIPEKDTKVLVRKIASMSQGGITEDFTDVVGKEIKLIAETIAQSLHAFTLGIDVMCQDISKPLTKENGAILEVNTMPESYLNFYPVLGKQRGYVTERYIDALLSENKSKVFVIVGQTTDDLPTLLRKKNVLGSSVIKKGDVVGEIKNGEYFIDGSEINEIEEHWKAVDALKMNSSLDILMLHHRDWNEVKERGLGFDHIDTLYVVKDQSMNGLAMKIVKKYKKMGLIDNIRII